MKMTVKFAAIVATAIIFAGCASEPKEDANMVTLRQSVEEARAAAIQANQTAQQALQNSQQNAAKIDRVFSKSQRK